MPTPDKRMERKLHERLSESVAEIVAGHEGEEFRGYLLVSLWQKPATGTDALRMYGVGHCHGCSAKIGELANAVRGQADIIETLYHREPGHVGGKGT